MTTSYSSLHSPWPPLVYFLSLCIWQLKVPHITGIIQNSSVCDWHIFTNIISSSLFLAWGWHSETCRQLRSGGGGMDHSAPESGSGLDPEGLFFSWEHGPGTITPMCLAPGNTCIIRACIVLGCFLRFTCAGWQGK